MNRILSIALSMFLVLGLFSGCSGSSQAPSGESAPASGTDSAETPETPAQPAAEGVTEIELWHSISGELAAALDQMVENFNGSVGAEKGIQVTTVFQDWPGTDKLVTVMQAGDIPNHPDLIQIYGENLNIVRDYERMVWVEDYINVADSTVKKGDLLPNAAQAFAVDGRMLGAPLTLSTILLYYNVDMFREAGIDAPPTTIAEMADMIPQLTKKNGDEIEVYGLNIRPDSYELNSWIAGQGESNYFGDNESGRTAPMTKVTLGENGTLAAFLDEWEKVVNSGGYKYQLDNMNEEFANEQHAMVIMSSARIRIMDNLIGDKFEWSVANLPKVNASDKGGASVSGGGLFMLNKDDPDKLAAAWEFVQYSLSPETQYFWGTNTGYVPVNSKTYDLADMQSYMEENPSFAVAVGQIEQSDPKLQEPYYPNADTIKTTVREALLLFADGKLDKEQAHSEIVDGCTAAIEDYYRANPLD